MNVTEQLYEALKNAPASCKCRYQMPVGPYNAAAFDNAKEMRKRVFQCERCKALERYELERDEF